MSLARTVYCLSLVITVIVSCPGITSTGNAVSRSSPIKARFPEGCYPCESSLCFMVGESDAIIARLINKTIILIFIIILFI